MSRQRKFILNLGLDFTGIWTFSRCPSVFGCGSLQSCRGTEANSLVATNLLPAASGLSAQRVQCFELVLSTVCSSSRCKLWSVPVIAVGYCGPGSTLQDPFHGSKILVAGCEFKNSGCGFPWVFCGSEEFPELMLLSEIL